MTLPTTSAAATTSTSSVSATASSLRWRARIAKEAMAFPFHDDNSSCTTAGTAPLAGDYDISEEKHYSKQWQSYPRIFRSIRSLLCSSRLLIPWLSTAAIVSSLYALRSSRSPLTTVTVTLTVVTCVAVLWQQHLLRMHGGTKASWRHKVQQTKERVQSLRTNRERFYRQIAHLDAKVERQRGVSKELTTLVGDDAMRDLSRLTQTTQAYKQCCLDVQKLLHRQVQEQILRAVLQTDRDSNFELSGMELEQLIYRLQSIDGVTFQESLLREILIDRTIHNNSDSLSSPSKLTGVTSLSSLFRLLQQVASDSDVAQAGVMTSRSRTGSTTRRPSSRLKKSVVFEFDAQKVLSTQAMDV